MANGADPDQLASSEANWSGSTLFANAGHIWVQQDIMLTQLCCYLGIQVRYLVFCHYFWWYLHLNKELGQVSSLLEVWDPMKQPFHNWVYHWFISLYKSWTECTPEKYSLRLSILGTKFQKTTTLNIFIFVAKNRVCLLTISMKCKTLLSGENKKITIFLICPEKI